MYIDIRTKDLLISIMSPVFYNYLLIHLRIEFLFNFRKKLLFINYLQ